jgi:hypothetical protein
MFGHTVKGITIRNFNNFSEIHDCNPVADVADYGEIMGDKEIGEIKLSLKVFQEVDDLCLDRDIERRDGFVADDKTGPDHII